MKTKIEQFEVLVPDAEGTGTVERVMVPIPLEWDEELNQWLIGPEANRIIEDTKARHMGLLLPVQLKELRERYNYTQKQMGELFQVGEKSWTRWESGKHRPSRVINLLIRALFEREISIKYLLKRAGKLAQDFDLTDEQRQISIWLSYASAPIGESYLLVKGEKIIQHQMKERAASFFTHAMLNNYTQQSFFPVIPDNVREISASLLPNKKSSRFEHEKINLDSPTLA